MCLLEKFRINIDVGDVHPYEVNRAFEQLIFTVFGLTNNGELHVCETNNAAGGTCHGRTAIYKNYD